MSHSRTFVFGPFSLLPERQLLLRGDAPVRLGGRALDLLTALVERPGELVSKAELMARAWPSTVVVEANLKVNMGALRRALDDDSDTSRYIATVTGRGYRFVASVQLGGPVDHSLAVPSPTARKSNLPTATTRIFGRAETIAALHRRLGEIRLLTVVGAGGIGKTTVALAVAEQCLDQFPDGVWLADLAKLSEPGLTAPTIATAVGFANHASNVLEALCGFLRDRHLLLVLDNCEHLIDPVAVCVARILSSAPGVQVLATSRQPLFVQGEHVHRLTALGTPPANIEISAEDSLKFPAVRLFVERATERLETFRLTDTNAVVVGEICRRLDGLALAIALAAMRIDGFGARGLLEQLDNRFGFLTGLRSDPGRHRTLTAILDWSYGLLPSGEAALLRAISVFTGLFDLEDAAAVSNGAPADMAAALAQLASKSMLDIDIDSDIVAYRLLETTRVYAMHQLRKDASGEQAVRRRHAERVCAVLARARGERAQLPAPQWGERYGRVLDDLRSALAWSRQHGDDRAMNVRLTVSGMLLWEHFSLTHESRAHTAQAINDLEAAGLVGTPYEMQLRLGLGESSMYIEGQKNYAREAMQRALAIAENLGDVDHQLRCLMSISVYQMWSGELRAGKRSMDAFALIAAAKDPEILIASEIHHGVGELMLGELESARQRFEQVRQRDFRSTSAASLGYILDPYALAGGILCQVQWLMGLPETALRLAESCLKAGQESGHHLTINNALSITCPVYYWTGQYQKCETCVTSLEEHYRRHRIITRRPITSFYRAALSFSQNGASPETIVDLQRAIEDFRSTNHLVRMPYYLSVLADALMRSDRLDEAEATINHALDVDRTQEEGWCLPEVLRVQASVLKAKGENAKAQHVLAQSMVEAGKVGARSWQLRSAIDLARLRQEGADLTGARSMLRTVLGQFTEGFDTWDVKTAKDLIAAFGHHEG